MTDVARLLDAAKAGDEAARAVVRSGRVVSVCRIGSPVGETRRLPQELDEVPPKRKASRRTPRSNRTSAGSPPTVEFSRDAWDELLEVAGDFDGYEVGGFLFGEIRGDAIVVREVVDEGIF